MLPPPEGEEVHLLLNAPPVHSVADAGTVVVGGGAKLSGGETEARGRREEYPGFGVYCDVFPDRSEIWGIQELLWPPPPHPHFSSSFWICPRRVFGGRREDGPATPGGPWLRHEGTRMEPAR